jgi:hypothetical protein
MNNETTKKVIGYRLRWRSDLTGNTHWYAPDMSTSIASKGTLFAMKEAAIACRSTLNDGWQKNAKVVRVIRTKRIKLNHLVAIPIGDFSNDGHSQSVDYYVKCNKSRDEVRDAWFAAKEQLPACCPSEFCAEYEDHVIDNDLVETLRSHGAPIPPDPKWVNPEDMLELTLWFLRVGDPDLRFEKIEAPSLMFCGADSKGRLSDGIGYGCFS